MSKVFYLFGKIEQYSLSRQNVLRTFRISKSYRTLWSKCPRALMESMFDSWSKQDQDDMEQLLRTIDREIMLEMRSAGKHSITKMQTFFSQLTSDCPESNDLSLQVFD